MAGKAWNLLAGCRNVAAIGWNVATHAWNVLARAWNMPARAWNVAAHGWRLPACCWNVATQAWNVAAQTSRGDVPALRAPIGLSACSTRFERRPHGVQCLRCSLNEAHVVTSFSACMMECILRSDPILGVRTK
jgi:hypothetical protein